MKRLTLILILAVLAAGVATTRGSSASFNDSSPCPASGPLLVCPTMYVGQPVHLQLIALAGCDVYRWEIVNGGLPAGLSMSSSGLVSGTPTVAATTQPWVVVHDLTAPEGGPSWCGGDNHSERQFVFTVSGGGGGSSTPAPPRPHSPPFNHHGRPRKSDRRYAVLSHAYGCRGEQSELDSERRHASAGVTLGANGVLSGTPTRAGSYAFTVRVEGGGRSASKELSLVVVEKLTASVSPDQTWEVGGRCRSRFKRRVAVPATAGRWQARFREDRFHREPGQRLDQLPAWCAAQAGTFSVVLTVTDADGASAEVTAT